MTEFNPMAVKPFIPVANGVTTPADNSGSDAHGVARDQLRSFIERIERLEEEKKSISDDIRDVYAEAKGTGFDTKILKEVIRLRKQDADERAERQAILDTYLIALGMAPEQVL